MLDFGCGEGERTAALASRFPGALVVGADVSVDCIDVARERWKRDNLSFESVAHGAVPYPDAYFCEVFCVDVLEHVHDVDGILHELKRVTRPGGALILDVPHPGTERLLTTVNACYFQQNGHQRVFDEAELTALMKTHGFRVEGAGTLKGIETVLLVLAFRRGAKVIDERGHLDMPLPRWVYWLSTLLSENLVEVQRFLRPRLFAFLLPFYLLLTPLRLAVNWLWPKTLRLVCRRV